MRTIELEREQMRELNPYVWTAAGVFFAASEALVIAGKMLHNSFDQKPIHVFMLMAICTVPWSTAIGLNTKSRKRFVINGSPETHAELSTAIATLLTVSYMVICIALMAGL